MRYPTWLTKWMNMPVHQPKESDGTRLKPTTKEGLDLGDKDEKKRLTS